MINIMLSIFPKGVGWSHVLRHDCFWREEPKTTLVASANSSSVPEAPLGHMHGRCLPGQVSGRLAPLGQQQASLWIGSPSDRQVLMSTCCMPKYHGWEIQKYCTGWVTFSRHHAHVAGEVRPKWFYSLRGDILRGSPGGAPLGAAVMWPGQVAVSPLFSREV